MGYDAFGQLGIGTSTSGVNSTPKQIVSANVGAIAAGSNHSLFLESDASLWAMGNNTDGQLGDGTFTKTNKPEQIISSEVIAIAAGFNHSLFLKADGSLWAMGNDGYGQLGVGKFGARTNQPVQVLRVA